MKRWTAWTAILLSVCLICLCCVSLADNSGAYEDDDAIWAAPGGMAGPGGASSGPSSGTSSGPRGPWEDPALVSGPWDSSSVTVTGPAGPWSADAATQTDLEPKINPYTVYYHEAEDALPARRDQTETGTGVMAPGIKELGFGEQNRTFLGWKVYRESDKKWLMQTAKGKWRWHEAKAAESGFFDYVLLQEGDLFDEYMEEDETVRFFAQWDDLIDAENVEVKIRAECDDEVPGIGSAVRFIAEVTGCNAGDYVLQWQTSPDGRRWSNVTGATGNQYKLVITERNKKLSVRVRVTLKH